MQVDLQEVFVPVSKLPEYNRLPQDINTGRTRVPLRDSHGREIPQGARVALLYYFRGRLTVVWTRSKGELPLEVRNVSEEDVDFLARYHPAGTR